jgi:predicted permease
MTVVTGMALAALSVGRTLAAESVVAWPRLAPHDGSARSPRRRMQLLASAGLALTMMLLVAAAVLLQVFLTRALVDHGFDPNRAVAVRVSLPPARYPGSASRAAFHAQLLASLERSAGAEAVGLATALPYRQPSGRFDFSRTPIAGPRDPLAMQVAEVRMATPGFFAAIGLPVAGREFAPTDVDGAERVAIISAQLARLHFPQGGAEGSTLYSGAAGALRVIGVVPDVRPSDGRQPAPAAYLPLSQNADILEWFASMNVILRGSNRAMLTRAVRTAVSSLDADVPVFDVRALTADVARQVAGPRYIASVLTAFAIAALMIAAIGVYGITAYSAARRTREIGVRVALGGTRGQVMRTILRDGVVVTATGVATGGAASMWLSQALTGMLQDVPPATFTSIVTVATILGGAALLAAYLPTRRATRMTAVEALRQE